jgi:CMP-N-acetylneuraminic acid synthetase
LKRVLALIPARGGSKGVPRKNIRLLGGKPLIQYSIETAQALQFVTDVVVSTDDEEIANVAMELGASVPGLRPKELASDSAPTIEVVIYSLRMLEEQGRTYDSVLLLQPTTPFRSVQEVELAYERFTSSNADSLISVSEIPQKFNPHWAFEAGEDDFLRIATGERIIISRRQDLPPAYFRDGSIYLTKSAVILNDHSMYGTKVSYFISKENPKINIDTMEDWIKASEYLNSLEKD